jgi:hemerythrin superfamily protein
MRATDLLREDHRRVHDMLLRFEALPPGETGGRQALLQRIVQELDVHATIEEETFYPAVRAASRRIDDAEAGHAHLRRVIAEVEASEPASDGFAGGVRLIKQIVLAHVMEEEGGIFLDAERLGGETLEQLGTQLEQRKQALQAAGPQRKVA